MNDAKVHQLNKLLHVPLCAYQFIRCHKQKSSHGSYRLVHKQRLKIKYITMVISMTKPIQEPRWSIKVSLEKVVEKTLWKG